MATEAVVFHLARLRQPCCGMQRLRLQQLAIQAMPQPEILTASILQSVQRAEEAIAQQQFRDRLHQSRLALQEHNCFVVSDGQRFA